MDLLDFHTETTFYKQTGARIFCAWVLTFLTRLGFIIGWTIITALVVSSYQITQLPFLYLTHGVFIICGTILYTTFIHRLKPEHTIILSIIGTITALFLSLIFAENLTLFIGFTLLAASLFLSQIAINLSLYIEDLFTPMEHEKAAPMIESSEIIAGLFGGAFITMFADKINPEQFISMWIIACVIMIPIIIFFIDLQNRIPILRFKKEETKNETITKTLSEVCTVFKKTAFLKTLVILIACQWLILNVLEFQYTKSVDQHLRKIQEETLAKIPHDSWMVNIANTPTEKKPTLKTDAESEMVTHITEQAVAKLLGMLHMIFSFTALLMQLFGVQKIRATLGVAGSALIHPIVTIISVMGMMLKFGITSSVSAKAGFEMTSPLFLNAYHASFYALKHHLRTYAKEFLDGIIKPLGALLGIGLIVLVQHLTTGPESTLILNLIMMSVLGIMVIAIFPLQKQYTRMAQQHLFLPGLHPAKLDAIEILGQKGHAEPGILLAYSLRNTLEDDLVRIKILETLGKIQDPETIPEILEALESNNEPLQLAAIDTLKKFKNLHTQVVAHAFSRHRIINTLKHVFNKHNTEEVRQGIIALLARFNEEETIKFLLDILNSDNDKMIIDALQACRVFKDPNAAYYLTRFLETENAQIKAQTIIALWHFKKYRPKVQKALIELSKQEDKESRIAYIRTIGTLHLTKEKKRLETALKSNDIKLRLEAALALAQCNDKQSVPVIAQFLLESTTHSRIQIRNTIATAPHWIQQKIQTILETKTVEKINQLLEAQPLHGTEHSLTELETPILEKLQHYYAIINKTRETARIQEILLQRRQKTTP